MLRDELIGTDVGDRFHVLRFIGRGGMGSVYEIVHKELGRHFAMKTLSPHLAHDRDALARFRREAEVIAKLRHPNIIEIVDWSVLPDGTPCAILEYLKGENLASALCQRGPLEWGSIAAIGDQVLSALEAAHRADIVHRDLKPQNVFLCSDGGDRLRVKLLDFGASKIQNAHNLDTTQDRLIGTPGFMAPEQVDGRLGDVAPRIDVWAMGAMLFMMATGRLPFTAETIPQLLYRICHAEPDSVLAYRDDAPAGFAELVSRTLSRDPSRRIVDARELRNGLRNVLGRWQASGSEDDDLSEVRSSPRVVPPTGTITFLFTDVEQSSRLWELHPETMNASIARHDEIMAEALEKRGAWVFKTVGDGIYAAFSDAASAVRAASEAQQALATADWGQAPPLQVRMALHTGPAHYRAGDYFGPTLNRLARVLSLGHGGQILLSSATASAVADRLPAAYELRDLGIHQLRDLSRPEHIYQLAHPELAAAFKTLRTAAKAGTNLPTPLSSFIGRARETEELKSALDVSRLVTVTGIGGCGKTRLAIQVASEMTESVADGVWFVELATLSDGNLVAQTVGEVLDLPREGLFAGAEPWLDRLARHLASRRALLVLDNCEHLTQSCSELAHTLLSRCNGLSILATSREPLGVAGEKVYPLSPFAVPDEIDPADGEALAALEPVHLFVERARLRHPGFGLTDENAAAVLRICRQLEGIPLAIEFAAARLTALSVESLEGRLSDRFSLLRRSDTSMAPRQRSLRALLDWSYELLDDAQRSLFMRLAVFRGTFTLGAAEAICRGGAVAAPDVLDLLDQLVHKSLLQMTQDRGEPRYRLLVTVREYALERLRESGEEEALRKAHCAWYVTLAEQSEHELRGSTQTSTLDLLEAELDNIRAALAWSLESGQGEGLRLAGALWWFWIVRGHLSEGRHHLEQVLAEEGSTAQPASVRAKATAGAGLLTVLADPVRAKEQLEKSLALAREAEDAPSRGLALFGLGLQGLYAGDLAAMQRSLGESRREFLELGDDWGRALASMFLGPVEGMEDREAGEATCRQAVEAFERTGDRVGLAYSLINFGEIPRAHGDDARAAELYEQGLRLCREVGDRTGTVVALTNLGMALSSCGDWARADEHLRESLALMQNIGFTMLAPHCLLGLAGVALDSGQHLRAAQLLGASGALKEAVAVDFHPADQVYFDRVFFRLRELVDPETVVREWKRGEELSLEPAIEFALGRGELPQASVQGRARPF